MEGQLISIFALMGMLSLYMVIATLVGKGIYSKMKNCSREDKIIISTLGGIFFPITIPLIILVAWVSAMVNIPLPKENEEKSIKESPNGYSKPKKEKEINTKFKVGDLVTGKKGNPGNYQIFYEGCVCRVLEVDADDEDMKIKLVDHIDKEANLKHLGRVTDVLWKDFTLIKTKKNKSKTSKKKK